MKPSTSFVRKALPAALLLAVGIGHAGSSLAQYPEDPSRLTIALPPPGAVTPPLPNDPIGARVERTPASDASKSTGADSRPSVLQDAMSDRPIIPSKAELPDAAFKKLDAGGKGYVSREDVKDVYGFGKSFELADANKDGRLDAAEFRKAWADYTGRKSG